MAYLENGKCINLLFHSSSKPKRKKVIKIPKQKEEINHNKIDESIQTLNNLGEVLANPPKAGKGLQELKKEAEQFNEDSLNDEDKLFQATMEYTTKK